jgi:hypothetical protein
MALQLSINNDDLDRQKLPLCFAFVIASIAG